MSEQRRIIHISSKHQITIPSQFFEALHFQDTVECICKDHELILRPIHKQFFMHLWQNQNLIKFHSIRFVVILSFL